MFFILLIQVHRIMAFLQVILHVLVPHDDPFPVTLWQVF
jgi:hypothetical protein